MLAPWTKRCLIAGLACVAVVVGAFAVLRFFPAAYLSGSPTLRVRATFALPPGTASKGRPRVVAVAVCFQELEAFGPPQPIPAKVFERKLVIRSDGRLGPELQDSLQPYDGVTPGAREVDAVRVGDLLVVEMDLVADECSITMIGLWDANENGKVDPGDAVGSFEAPFHATATVLGRHEAPRVILAGAP